MSYYNRQSYGLKLRGPITCIKNHTNDATITSFIVKTTLRSIIIGKRWNESSDCWWTCRTCHSVNLTRSWRSQMTFVLTMIGKHWLLRSYVREQICNEIRSDILLFRQATWNILSNNFFKINPEKFCSERSPSITKRWTKY